MNSSISSSRTVAWTVWAIASLFYAYQYIIRVMPNIMLEDIMNQFNINAATFGQFSGIYYIGYSLMHIPIGIMLDRFGPKVVIPSCILLMVAGLTPLLFADHWVYPIIGRCLIGMGSSAAILGVFKIIRMTFSEQRFPRMLSFSVTIGLIGAIYGGGPVSYMCSTLGYHNVIQIIAIAGVALAIASFLILPKIPSTQKSSISSDIGLVLSNTRVLWSCIFAGMMVGPLEGFADVWGTAFLKQVYGLDTTIAASLPSMIFIGMCFGAPVLSFIADKTGSYIGTIIGSGIIMAMSFFLMIAWPVSSQALSFNFVIVGICCAYQILAIYKASTYVPEHVAGLTTAVANMIIMTFGYVFHAIIGTMIDAMGGPSVPAAFTYGIAVIPLGLCIGSAGYIYLLIKERATRTRALPN